MNNNIVVMKFGGTSLTTIDKKERILKLVKQTLKRGEFPVVVVSAIGRFTEPYATDTLLSLIKDNNNLQATDLLMCCGEIISAVIMSNFFDNNNIRSIPLTGGQAGIITNNKFSDADIIRYDNKIISKFIEDGIVPVVTGFQGITEDGFLTTLGRGGSDTTATILGANLNALRVEIYKDVDGIMTGDPKEDNNVELISYLTYDEAFDIANSGARVIHAKAINFAKEKNIPIHVKNLFGNKSGTIIKN